MTIAHRARTVEVAGVDEALELIRSQGLRVSATRKLVLDALFAANVPLSAEEIAGAGEDPPRADLASVYRNLEALERLGLVRHVHLGHGPGLYALAAAADREHLVCESCGRVEALGARELEDVLALIRERFGFRARFSHFPLTGVCADCAEREGAG
jgi:Fur family transcriptional regulator, ferric uptake regulator